MRARPLAWIAAALIAVGGAAWLAWPAPGPGATQSHTATLSVLTPSGAATSPPFARGEAPTPTPPAQPSLADLKRQYFALHDRAARFALLKDRPEPEAQYLAYRAFHECGRVMSSLRDGNDLAYRMKQLWAEQGATDRAAREAALQQWESACRGFLRPNPDVKRDAEALLRSAIAAGHAGAKALAFDLSVETDPATVADLATKIVDSGDPLALFDGHEVMLRARMSCSADNRAEEEYVAWILAACRLSDCYRTDLFFAYGLCALEGACEQKSVESIYLNRKRGEAERQRLLQRVGELERQMREGRKQELLACRGS